jgi:glycosyltransferase involved in cell wall biosynthesis
MSAGVPVVASKVYGVPETIQDGQEGFLLEKDDISGFVTRTHQLLKDPSLHSRTVTKASQKVSEEFTVERMRRRYVAFFRSCVSYAPMNDGESEVEQWTGGASA